MIQFMKRLFIFKKICSLNIAVIASALASESFKLEQPDFHLRTIERKISYVSAIGYRLPRMGYSEEIEGERG